MTKKFSALFKVLVLFTMISSFALAQESDDSFEALMNEPTNGAVKTQAIDKSESGQSLTILNDSPQRAEYALYGFSVGGIASNMAYTYTIQYYDPKPVPVQTSGTDVRNGPTTQTAGVIVRYSILPVGSLGTDLNISYQTSPEDKAISIAKGELNLGYAFAFNKEFKVYILGGAGVQSLSGGDVEKVMQPMGYGVQGGAGINLTVVNVDVMYSLYRNKINQANNNAFMNENPQSTIRTEKSYVESQGLSARATFNF